MYHKPPSKHLSLCRLLHKRWIRNFILPCAAPRTSAGLLGLSLLRHQCCQASFSHLLWTFTYGFNLKESSPPLWICALAFIPIHSGFHWLPKVSAFTASSWATMKAALVAVSLSSLSKTVTQLNPFFWSFSLYFALVLSWHTRLVKWIYLYRLSMEALKEELVLLTLWTLCLTELMVCSHCPRNACYLNSPEVLFFSTEL